MHHPWRFNGLNPNYKYPDGRACAVASAYSYGLGWLRDCDGKISLVIVVDCLALEVNGA